MRTHEQVEVSYMKNLIMPTTHRHLNSPLLFTNEIFLSYLHVSTRNYSFTLSFIHVILTLSLSLYIYIYIYTRVCACVCVQKK